MTDTEQQTPSEPYVLWLVMEEKDGLCLRCPVGPHIHVDTISAAAAGVQRGLAEIEQDQKNRQLADLISTAVVEATRSTNVAIGSLANRLREDEADAEADTIAMSKVIADLVTERLLHATMAEPELPPTGSVSG